MKDIIHDIRNDLTIIKILVKNLENELPDNDEVKLLSEALQRLNENVKSIQKD